MTRIALPAVILFGLLGCSKKEQQKEDPGPPCSQVVDKMVEITMQVVPGHDPSMFGDKKQMIAECEQRKMPASQRKCIVAAKTKDDLAKCRPEKPAAPPAEPTTTRPLPTGSGSSQ